MSETVKRLFIACPLPDIFEQELLFVQPALKADLPGARFTKEQGWHITLAFLGETDTALLPSVEKCLKEAVKGVCAGACKLGRLGHFGQRQSALLFCGIEGAGHLSELSGRVRAQLDFAGVSYDKKPFRPHITLARRADIRRINLPDYAPEGKSGYIDRAVLFESELYPRGPVYTPLAEQALARANYE